MAVAKPTLVIPTGYEQQQRAAATKRKLAEAMMARGIEPQAQPVHWAQVLGQLAQAWAGKSMTKDADKLDAEVAGKIREDYADRRKGFYGDRAALDNAGMVEKYGNDPLLADDLKPILEAYGAKLKQDQELTKNGSTWSLKGNIAPGSTVAPDMNDAVISDGKGGWMVNPVKVTAGVAAQGLPIEGYPMSMTPPTPGGPQVGQEEDGYIFLGGNPGDPVNWRKK